VSPETERTERYRRKSPQKRPILTRPGNLRVGRTGWWSWKGPNCQPPTQSSNRSPPSESGTEFFAAETGRQNGPIHPIAGAVVFFAVCSRRIVAVNAFRSWQKGSGLSLYQVVSVVRTGSRSVLKRQTVPYSATIYEKGAAIRMRIGDRSDMTLALSLGRCKPFFDGAVLRLSCVNRDRAEQAEGPATSAMPRKRRPAVKMSLVATRRHFSRSTKGSLHGALAK
jgi:hypothetical protein